MAGSTLRGKQVMVDDSMDLPPGFRFHPTDEEIITYYLLKKVTIPGFTSRAMGDVDLNMCEPSELPRMAQMRDEWYFFCQNEWKYPTGTRANRATKEGYWKATGKDKEIYRDGGILVGLKKTLVFYRGRAPRGEKTDWVIHEFRLAGASQHLVLNPRTTKCEWVVCKVFQKSTKGTRIDPVQVEAVPGMNSSPDDSAPSNLGVDVSSYQTQLNLPNGCRPNSSFADNAEASSSRGRPWSNFSIRNMGMDQMPNYCYSDTNSHGEDDASLFMLQDPYSSPPPGLYNLAYLHPEHAMVNPVAGFAYGRPNDMQNVNQRTTSDRNNETSSPGYVELGGASPAGHLALPQKWKQ